MNWEGRVYFSWQGRQLNGFWKDNYCEEYQFHYNPNGIRTRKYYEDWLNYKYIVVDYVLDGSKIIKETRTGYGLPTGTIYYYYDNTGSVIGFNYNNADYYYGKNLQGDVTIIYDSNANPVVYYK